MERKVVVLKGIQYEITVDCIKAGLEGGCSIDVEKGQEKQVLCGIISSLEEECVNFSNCLENTEREMKEMEEEIVNFSDCLENTKREMEEMEEELVDLREKVSSIKAVLSY